MDDLIKIIEQDAEEEKELIKKFKITVDNIQPLTSILRSDWNSYFMMLAQDASSRSTCLSRQNGAVIIKGREIVSTGYNGAGPGLKDCTELGYCLRRKKKAQSVDDILEKYDVETITTMSKDGTLIKNVIKDAMKDQSQYLCKAFHAEHNAILQAAKHGIALDNSQIYVTLFPCDGCAKEIVRAGIKTVYFMNPINDSQKHGGEVTESIKEMFKNKTIAFYEHNPTKEFMVAFRVYRHLNGSQKKLF